MTQPLAPITALGEQIAAGWLAAGRDPTALPAIATDALTAARIPERVAVSDLTGWVLRCPRSAFPEQADPLAQFGDPPVTLWRGAQLRIDLQLWVDSAPDIHDHAFSGAFQVLAGQSLAGRYTFTESSRYGPSLRLGAITQTALERLQVGDVCPIAPGSGLIHSLFHLDRPSATLVVRTDSTPDFAPQSIYLTPGIACASYPAQLRDDPLYQRRMQLLGFFQRTGDPAYSDALYATMAEADPIQALTVLGYVFDALAAGPSGEAGAAEQLSGLLATTTQRYPPLGPLLLPVLLQAHRRKRIVSAREAVPEPALRTLLALLLYAEDRESLERLVPDPDPAAWLARSCDALAARGLEIALPDARP